MQKVFEMEELRKTQEISTKQNKQDTENIGIYKAEAYKKTSAEEKYADIIHLLHPASKKHPRMNSVARAAQFSPFAALTGYDSAVKETARLTESRIELDEYSKEVLDQKLWEIREHLHEHPEVKITYFQPDEQKSGGAYLTIRGIVKKIDTYGQCIVLEDGKRVPIGEIIEMECDKM